MSVLIVAIFVALGAMYWYQTTFDTRIMDMNNRAGAIEEKYQSFTKDLHVLDMKFIGREIKQLHLAFFIKKCTIQ
jgi:hypothetical protein